MSVHLTGVHPLMAHGGEPPENLVDPHVAPYHPVGGNMRTFIGYADNCDWSEIVPEVTDEGWEEKDWPIVSRLRALKEVEGVEDLSRDA